MSTTTPDRIRLSGLSARGYHGVLPFERAEGQLFTVDVTLDLGERGTAVASVTDEAKDATDYSAVARAVVAASSASLAAGASMPSLARWAS